jgi:hypothetical protein
VIHSLTAKIGHVHDLLISFFEGRMISRWIVTNIRSRNIALPQDSHSLRRSTRDLWNVGEDVESSSIVIPTIHETYVGDLSINHKK